MADGARRRWASSDFSEGHADAGFQAPYNLRYDHQTAAANTRQAPNGSGTQNAPSVASAAGDLIFRKLFIPAHASLTKR